MKKTIKIVYVKEPHNYWINRRVYLNEQNEECIKLNYIFVKIDWLKSKGWEINYSY